MKKFLLIKNGATLGAGVAKDDDDLADAIKEFAPLIAEGCEIKIVDGGSMQEEIRKNLMHDNQIMVNVKALDGDSARKKLEALLEGNQEIEIVHDCYDDDYEDYYEDDFVDDEYDEDEVIDEDNDEDENKDEIGNDCVHREKCDGTVDDWRRCLFSKLL